jgi:hypothetical protein
MRGEEVDSGLNFRSLIQWTEFPIDTYFCNILLSVIFFEKNTSTDIALISHFQLLLEKKMA